jgi:transposase
MFIRNIHQNNGKISILIVENIRINGKPIQRTLRHVATVLPEEVEMFTQMAEYIKAEMENKQQIKDIHSKMILDMVSDMVCNSRKKRKNTNKLPVDLCEMREEHRVISGIHDIYGKMYDEIGFSQVLKRCSSSKKVMKDIVMARLAKPCSKLASSELLRKDFGIDIQIMKIYRMMDKLTENAIKDIQSKSWDHSKRLFAGEINVMFYDCTTLYFESFKEDELRKFGYSKDLKFNQGQILLALMVTNEGLPIGYEVFPGNTNESKTFSDAIEKIKKRYQILRIVIVADSGVLSKDNIDYIEKSGLEYILGARLKSLTKEWQNTITNQNNQVEGDLKTGDDILKIAVYQHTENCKLIVTHSSKRALKDCHDREKAVEKLRVKVSESKNPKSLISNYGYKKFLTVDGEVRIGVDEEKLAKEKLWDGLHGVFTNMNMAKTNVNEVLNQYHGLWQVEESFRINKHDLRMRPIFHWTPKRIKAHIAICFMSFSLIRFIQHKIKQQTNENYSAERIRSELYAIQESVIINKSDGNRYVIPSKLSDDATKMYKIMKRKRDNTPYKLIDNLL